MKKAFTLVELLITVAVIVTLMQIVFRLGAVNEESRKRTETVVKLQKLENCLSGYNAAFGNYPPVKLHGSRNVHYKVNRNGIQQVNQNPNTGGKLDWASVDAACRSQPVVMNFPYGEGSYEYIRKVSVLLKKKHDEGKKPFCDCAALANLFDALENPGMLSGKRGDSEWTNTQIFRFGLLSFLLPRYEIMMRHKNRSNSGWEEGEMTGNGDLSLYDDFAQWGNNNQKPCRFEDGSLYLKWEDVAAGEAWQIRLLPSQAVTERWAPNLEGDMLTWLGGISEYEIPDIYSAADSQGGEQSGGTQQYVLDGYTVRDGWGSDFYYYSKPPYQSYRLWSAGPNGRTFPPWISEEEIATLDAEDQKKVLLWVSDDIVKMKN